MVRLGYACINTVLRAENVFSNRTLRLSTLKEKGVDYAKELGLLNTRDLLPIIKWNEDHDIRFFRLSSCIFPFASDMTYGYDLKYAEKDLRAVGDLARSYGHRLTTHPGQYDVLCSPNDVIVAKTIRDLGYHAEMLDLMGLDSDSVMVIHMGGTYGDKKAAIARFENNFIKLPEYIRNRLVLENDEYCYNVEELLPTCKKLGIPLVVDWHHDRLYPSSQPLENYISEINAIWHNRGIRPKQHYSESAKGHSNPRTHSDYVKRLPPCAPDMDLMIEAKMKEQTVLRICKKYGISPDSTAPLRHPKKQKDESSEEEQNDVELVGRARKKHTWSKQKTAKETKLVTEETNKEINTTKKKKNKTSHKVKVSRKRKSTERDEEGEKEGENPPIQEIVSAISLRRKKKVVASST